MIEPNGIASKTFWQQDRLPTGTLSSETYDRGLEFMKAVSENGSTRWNMICMEIGEMP
jgi:hypothetical protein